MKRLLTSSSLLLLFILFFLYPDSVKSGAQEGLSLWYHSVLPILFPFILLSNIMISTQSLHYILHPFFRLFSHVPGINPWTMYPILFGLFCGFPMGGKMISDLIEEGRLTEKEGNQLLPIVSQASPMFIIGYVGNYILKNSVPLHHLLLSIYLPPFLYLFLISLLNQMKHIWSRKVRQRKNLTPSQKDKQKILFEKTISATMLQKGKKNSMSRNPEHTIWDAFTIIVTIGIYMMIFTIAVNLCKQLLPENKYVSALLCTLEFSTGLEQLLNLSFLPLRQKTGLLLSLTAFGGFCTAAQTYGIVKKQGLSLSSYLLNKFLYASFTYLYYWASSSSSY